MKWFTIISIIFIFTACFSNSKQKNELMSTEKTINDTNSTYKELFIQKTKGLWYQLSYDFKNNTFETNLSFNNPSYYYINCIDSDYSKVSVYYFDTYHQYNNKKMAGIFYFIYDAYNLRDEYFKNFSLSIENGQRLALMNNKAKQESDLRNIKDEILLDLLNDPTGGIAVNHYLKADENFTKHFLEKFKLLETNTTMQ